MRIIDGPGFGELLQELRRRGYQLVGPTLRDGAIVFDRIEGADDLAQGVTDVQEPGAYSVSTDPQDPRYFGFSHGPDSAKRFLFPARELLGSATHRSGTLTLEPPEDEDRRPFAFIGLRSCDLHAIASQDRVFLGGPEPDKPYRSRRRRAFVLAVNCAEPGATCFCSSMGTGPRCAGGFDLALTELSRGFLVEIGTPIGDEVLTAVGSRPATTGERRQASRITADAIARMGRSLDTSDLPELLYRNRANPRWDEVASRCLACGNCTAVCPTCFCHDVLDQVDLLGTTATRSREWASCFSEEFSHMAGGEVRRARSARYRQWLTHKFASWIDQFGTSGCVGCGRCITWCPVGIDVTEEIRAIRSTDLAHGQPSGTQPSMGRSEVAS